MGIYGNSKEEALYPVYSLDGAGAPLDGSRAAYSLTFPPGGEPPVEAFWSVTVYTLPESLLYANEERRYLINSPMVPGLARDGDGGLTLRVSHAPPADAAARPNWLPCPAAPFIVFMRLYCPRPAAYDGTWVRPEFVAMPLK